MKAREGGGRFSRCLRLPRLFECLNKATAWTPRRQRHKDTKPSSPGLTLCHPTSSHRPTQRLAGLLDRPRLVSFCSGSHCFDECSGSTGSGSTSAVALASTCPRQLFVEAVLFRTTCPFLPNPPIWYVLRRAISRLSKTRAMLKQGDSWPEVEIIEKKNALSYSGKILSVNEKTFTLGGVEYQRSESISARNQRRNISRSKKARFVATTW